VLQLSPKHFVLAAALAVPLGCVGALMAAGGSAQTASSARTLHFVAIETGGFESSGRFGEGSIAGFRDRLKADDGTEGRDVGVCVITSLRRKEALCHDVAIFPEGRLFFEWLNRESSKRQVIALVGGTGSYEGARGTAVAIEGKRTGITVRLTD
jgi:hypothetical protein